MVEQSQSAANFSAERRKVQVWAKSLTVVASLFWVPPAPGQPQVVNSVRLELRIQPQTGLPGDPGGVVDVPGTAHDPITGPGQLRRFEVQYRVMDLDAADGVLPQSVFSFQFALTFSGGGNASLERAVLSRAENSVDPPPAMSPDTSGVQGAPFAPPRESRGLHRPFYRSFGDPPVIPSNDAYENGRIVAGPGGSGQVITEIHALRLAPTPVSDLGVWYGLYSFNFTSGTELGSAVVLRATFQAPDRSPTFGFWTADPSSPSVSFNTGIEVATIAVPAPGGVGMVPLVLTVIAGRRRCRSLARSPNGTPA